MEDRPYTATQVLQDRWAYYAEMYGADFADKCFVNGRRYEAVVLSGITPKCNRSHADSEHEVPGVDDARVGAALDRPPGLGGPREFAVPAHHLIALMEHVAAVRRIARRGWRDTQSCPYGVWAENAQSCPYGVWEA